MMRWLCLVFLAECASAQIGPQYWVREGVAQDRLARDEYRRERDATIAAPYAPQRHPGGADVRPL